ncbi:MAG: hypothetical protein LUI10_06215 [Lachnospiraceae bacterium]|nr:hypothetical protein [Lachnospiraceae bacterium]
MKNWRGIFTALIWLLFTVPVMTGGTIYYFEAVASFTEADLIALFLWICILLMITGFTTLLGRWTDLKPGVLRMGKGASLALEMICCVILTCAGIYFRIGQEFVTFWSRQDGNPVVAAALVTLNRTADGFQDPVTAAYVWLLNRVFLLVGNLTLAAAGMQLVIFILCCVLLYFLVRHCYGAFPAVICLGGLMLLPQMIRASMYCSPEILLFLVAVLLGWILHLTLDKRMEKSGTVLLDFTVVVLFVMGCVYVDRSGWSLISAETFTDRVLAVSGQAAFIPGVLCAVIFLFLKARRTAAVYMLMAVLLIVIQMLGFPDSVGCDAVLGVVMSILLGISLDGLLLKEPASQKGKAAQEAKESDFEVLSEESFPGEEEAAADEKELKAGSQAELQAPEGPVIDDTQSEKVNAAAVPQTAEKTATDDTQAAEEKVKEEPRAAGEITGAEVNLNMAGSTPEIFIPASMEIPKRKKRARIDFDREFSEEEMNFDVEVEDGEEFDK